MADIEQHSPSQSPEARAKRQAFAVRAQEIAGNPLDAEDLALFEMFDQEGMTDDGRIAYLTAEAWKLAAR